MRPVVSLILLIVFVVTASQPVQSYSCEKTPPTFQNHLENLTVSVTPDWQKSMMPATVLIGKTWNIFFKIVRVSEAPDICVHDLYLLVPKSNAP